jgi:hypothetical protein
LARGVAKATVEVGAIAIRLRPLLELEEELGGDRAVLLSDALAGLASLAEARGIGEIGREGVLSRGTSEEEAAT